MRWLVLLAILAHASTAAAGDGYYFEESLGGVSYRGDLARYSTGAPRVQFGFNVRRGDFTVEVFGAFVVPDLFFIDCVGETECAAAVAPPASIGAFGVDLRQRWPLARSRWQRFGLWMNLHAGPRWFEGVDALDGYRGPGVGVGAGAELDIWVIGYFIDFGIDAMRLDGPGDPIHATTPHVMLGGKLGWL